MDPRGLAREAIEDYRKQIADAHQVPELAHALNEALDEIGRLQVERDGREGEIAILKERIEELEAGDEGSSIANAHLFKETKRLGARIEELEGEKERMRGHRTQESIEWAKGEWWKHEVLPGDTNHPYVLVNRIEELEGALRRIRDYDESPCGDTMEEALDIQIYELQQIAREVLGSPTTEEEE